jgi:superfamily II DNA or RNA helicase
MFNENSEWVLPNRAFFPVWALEKFSKIDMQDEKGMTLFRHQRIVREFMSPDSPFRGLLLFHGLGVGKTCAAIAVAELLYGNVSKVVVLTQRSLRHTFQAEMLKCGSTIRDQKFSKDRGSWVPDPENGVEYSELADKDRDEVDKLLKNLVENRYEFINYNGIGHRHIDGNYDVEYFANSLVIIDEAHRFVTRSMKPGAVANELYGRIYRSSARMLLLSGTPIVNTPFELSLMLNLVNGPILHWVLRGFRASSIDALKRDARVDSVSLSRDGRELVVLESNGSRMTENDFQPFLLHSIGSAIRESGDNLPMDQIQFEDKFCDFEKSEVKNPILFMRRASGLVSHFDERDPALYPTLNKRVFIKLPMSDHQFGAYSRVRLDEIRKERFRKQFEHSRDPNSKSGSSNYKSFSRALCNFAFPDDIVRPYPTRSLVVEEDAEDESIDGDDVESETNVMDYKHQIAKCLRKLGESGLLKRETLSKYSPKMSAIADAVSASPGKCLVYSEFRLVEGMTIMSMALEARGHRRLSVKRSKTHHLEVSVGPGDGPLFAQYDSSDPQGSAAIIDIFNKGFYDGLEVRTLLISASGSEGLSLKNVRQVHVMEPFWNDVRVQQVIGRAVRAYSHAELPIEDQNVTVFQYVAQFPHESKDVIFVLRTTDKGLTADELVLQLSEKKTKMTHEFIRILRAGAVDCNTYASGARHNTRQDKCFNLPPRVPDDAIIRSTRFSDDLDDQRFDRKYPENAKNVAKPVKRLELEDEQGVRFAALQLEDGRIIDEQIFNITGRFRMIEGIGG